jgi:hypothetical protein
VIQKATSKTGTIFTADNETLKDEIRRRQQQVKSAGPNDGETDIFWSPQTEVGYALLEGETIPNIPPAPVIQNVTLEFKKRAAAPAPVIVEPTAPQSIVEITPEVIPKPPAPIATPEPSLAFTENDLSEDLAEELPEETESEETFDDATFDNEGSYLESELIGEVTSPDPLAELASVRSLRDISELRTNTLIIGLVGTASVCVVVVILVQIAFSAFSPKSESELVAPPVTPIITLATAIDVPLSTISSEQLIEQISNQKSSDETTEMRFVDKSGLPLSVDKLLGLFALSVNPSFNKSVRELHIAKIGTNRAIIFTVTDSVTVFGSLFLVLQPLTRLRHLLIKHTKQLTFGFFWWLSNQSWFTVLSMILQLSLRRIFQRLQNYLMSRSKIRYTQRYDRHHYIQVKT